MRIVIRPVGDPECEIDVTQRLTAAIAEALWEARGGNDVVNWLEAERHLARLAAGLGAREEAGAAARMRARPGARAPRAIEVGAGRAWVARGQAGRARAGAGPGQS